MKTLLEIRKTKAEWYQKNKAKQDAKRITWHHELRQKAINLLGGKCEECGTIERLHLHHKFYAKDSVRPSQNESGHVTVKRTQEAIAHPSRFSLLCLSCHNSIHPKNKSAGMFENDKSEVNVK